MYESTNPETTHDLRARLRDFIDAEVMPLEQSLLDLEQLSKLRGLSDEARRLQLWGLGMPADLGGHDLPILEQVLVNEVIGRSEPAAAVLGFHNLDEVLRIRRFGTPEQQDRWLPPLARGEVFAGLAVTEPDVAGSDAKIMRTPAHLDGDHWVLHGRKWFTTWADRAAFFVVIAITDPTAEFDRRSTAFLVPRETPGLRIERSIPVMGDGASIYGELALEGVRLPKTAVLGPRGRGLAVAGWRAEPSRLLAAMRWVGQAQRAFELMCRRANVRWSHGAYLRDEGEVHRYVAESAASIHAARLMALDAAYALQAGEQAPVRSSLVKLTAARTLHEVTDRAIQVHGAAGVSGDLPLERMYRNARLAQLHDLPDEVHRMHAAQQLLDDPETVPWHQSAVSERAKPPLSPQVASPPVGRRILRRHRSRHPSTT